MITYIKQMKKNPINKEVKYYAQIAPVNVVNLDEVATRVSRCCTVTSHDIKAVISALQEQLIDMLRSGQSVRLGDIGSFRPTITSEACDSPEEVTAKSVKGIRVRFTPGCVMREGLALNNSLVRFACDGNVAAEDSGTAA